MTPKSPSNLWRDHLAKRSRKARIEAGEKIGKLTENEKKTPSQRRSENGKKRERKRAGDHTESCNRAARDLIMDCYTCPHKPCGSYMQICDEKTILERCSGCGQPVLHWVDENVKWSVCNVCRSKK